MLLKTISEENWKKFKPNCFKLITFAASNIQLIDMISFFPINIITFHDSINLIGILITALLQPLPSDIINCSQIHLHSMITNTQARYLKKILLIRIHTTFDGWFPLAKHDILIWWITDKLLIPDAFSVIILLTICDKFHTNSTFNFWKGCASEYFVVIWLYDYKASWTVFLVAVEPVLETKRF